VTLAACAHLFRSATGGVAGGQGRPVAKDAVQSARACASERAARCLPAVVARVKAHADGASVVEADFGSQEALVSEQEATGCANLCACCFVERNARRAAGGARPASQLPAVLTGSPALVAVLTVGHQRSPRVRLTDKAGFAARTGTRSAERSASRHQLTSARAHPRRSTRRPAALESSRSGAAVAL